MSLFMSKFSIKNCNFQLENKILILFRNKIMRHQLDSRSRKVDKNRNTNGYPIEDTRIMRQIQLEKDS